MAEDPEVTTEVADEMRSRFFEQVLVDLESKTENWQLTITPLGDSVGFRAEMYITDDTQSLLLAGASHQSALTAGSMAVGRGLTAIEAAITEEAESEMDSREQ